MRAFGSNDRRRADRLIATTRSRFRLQPRLCSLRLAYAQTIESVGFYGDVPAISPVVSLARESINYSVILTNNLIDARKFFDSCYQTIVIPSLPPHLDCLLETFGCEFLCFPNKCGQRLIQPS